MKGICPICKEPNHCAMEAQKASSTCWCMNVKVPKELLEKVPEALKGLSCVCEKCVMDYIEQHRCES